MAKEIKKLTQKRLQLAMDAENVAHMRGREKRSIEVKVSNGRSSDIRHVAPTQSSNGIDDGRRRIR
tara:strand:- start:106 stop:303 length:198 start_codon:yes stop_codon:yes gene_type:complete